MKNKLIFILAAFLFVFILKINIDMIGTINDMKELTASNEESVVAIRTQINDLKDKYEKTSHTKMYKIDVFLEKAMNKISSLNSDKLCALIAIDGDKFGTKTKEFGDAVVDELVVEIGAVLRNHFSDQDKDILCNIGNKSDEIFILLTERDCIEDIEKEVVALQEKIRKIEVPYKDTVVKGTISLGIVTFKPQESDFRFMFTTADDALYEAKDKGRDTYVIKQK